MARIPNFTYDSKNDKPVYFDMRGKEHRATTIIPENIIIDKERMFWDMKFQFYQATGRTKKSALKNLLDCIKEHAL